MKDYIIANFKMHKTSTEVRSYLNSISKMINDGEKVYICLPYTSLYFAKKLTKPHIVIGAQNISDAEEGKLTGEISAKMLLDLGVSTTIIGHSERRQIFYEDDKLINRKIKTALKNGMTVIFCIGETRGQKNSKRTVEVLTKQITEGLAGIYENELKNVIIAYEPVWAIGTGQSATPAQIETTVKDIRNAVSDLFSKKAGEDIAVVYGGSLDENNAKKILSIKNVNGALIGGASLDPKKLMQIVRA